MPMLHSLISLLPTGYSLYHMIGCGRRIKDTWVQIWFMCDYGQMTITISKNGITECLI